MFEKKSLDWKGLYCKLQHSIIYVRNILADSIQTRFKEMHAKEKLVDLSHWQKGKDNFFFAHRNLWKIFLTHFNDSLQYHSVAIT